MASFSKSGGMLLIPVQVPPSGDGETATAALLKKAVKLISNTSTVGFTPRFVPGLYPSTLLHPAGVTELPVISVNDPLTTFWACVEKILPNATNAVSGSNLINESIVKRK